MPAPRAIDLALDLARMPSLAAVMRERPLPLDILDVIRIAAGWLPEPQAAFADVKLPFSAIQAAAILYLEEMLFFPDAGVHRNLGVSAGSSRAQMRLHMRWLLQWLHPDHNSDETAALLAARVISAWRQLGRRDQPEGGSITREKLALEPRGEDGPGRRVSIRVRWIAVPIPQPQKRRRWWRVARDSARIEVMG